MKNSTWLRRILTFLLTLVVLAGVGFAGFRIGVMQGANLSAEDIASLAAKGRGGEPAADGMRAQGFDGHNFANRGFEHGRDFGGRGGFSFFSPLFGLIRLAVLAGFAWLAYTFVKRSGWRLVKAESTVPAPAVTPAAADEEKPESA